MTTKMSLRIYKFMRRKVSSFLVVFAEECKASKHVIWKWAKPTWWKGKEQEKKGGRRKKNPNMGSSVIINRIVFTLSEKKMFVRPNKVHTPAKMYILFADLGICHLSHAICYLLGQIKCKRVILEIFF